MPPAARPAKAPARARLVGAALRTAQIEIAKGTIAMIGMDIRHSSHSLPTIILSQCELGARARLIPASTTMTKNGMATKNDGVFLSPPGRASLVRETNAR